MKLIPALLPACALLLPCALAAESFEGKVSMKMSSPGSKDGGQSLEMSMKEGYLRVDMNGQNGFGGMITDFKNQQMIILMAQQRMYMVRPMPQPGANPAPNTAAAAPRQDLEDTGVKETILGYECTKYISKGARGTSELWVTDQLGTFGGLYHGGGPGRQAQASQPWESALQGKNAFPMRVVTTVNGTEKFRLEVTSVEKTRLPDSLFAPPDGWRKLDLGGLMGGAMPGNYPGARPSGGNN